MWVSVALETDAAHADALSDALLAAGAISVSVEARFFDLETPQLANPTQRGAAATPLWTESRVVLFDPARTDRRIAAAAARPKTCPRSNWKTSPSRTGCA